MKKKVVSLIMSVALAFSSMHVMNIAAENVKAESNLTEATVTNLNISTGNYEFIDIASNGMPLRKVRKFNQRMVCKSHLRSIRFSFIRRTLRSSWRECKM